MQCSISKSVGSPSSNKSDTKVILFLEGKKSDNEVLNRSQPHPSERTPRPGGDATRRNDPRKGSQREAQHPNRRAPRPCTQPGGAGFPPPAARAVSRHVNAVAVNGNPPGSRRPSPSPARCHRTATATGQVSVPAGLPLTWRARPSDVARPLPLPF